MRLTLFSASAQQSPGRIFLAALLGLSLAGCSHTAPPIVTKGLPSPLSEPESKIVDFQLVDCQHIWSWVDGAAVNNPLYWLRAVDCAVRLSPADARAQAKRWAGDSWHGAFKQAVLLSNGNITPPERRDYLQRLDSYSYDYPSAVRPLLMLWREGQGSLLQLSQERSRYASLQESSDAQLDALRHQQIAVNKELAVTQRKLETLSDIERKLSARRSPDAADSTSHGVDKTAPDDSTPADIKSEDDANP